MASSTAVIAFAAFESPLANKVNLILTDHSAQWQLLVVCHIKGRASAWFSPSPKENKGSARAERFHRRDGFYL